MSATIWMFMIPFMLLAILIAVGPMLWVMSRESRGVAAYVAGDSRSPIRPFELAVTAGDEPLRVAS